MEYPAPVATQQLQVLFCQRFRCPPSAYEARAFRRCLYLHAKLLAPLLQRLKPEVFAQDFRFIRHLGESTSLQEATVDLLNFRDVNLGRPSFWRTDLRIRVSGRKASRLAHDLFRAERETGVGPG